MAATTLPAAPTALPDFLLDLLEACVHLDASDLHLTPDSVPYLRRGGVLEPRHDWDVLSASQVEACALAMLGSGERRPLEDTGAIDGALTVASARFRFNIFRRQGQLAIALRRLEEQFCSLRELGLPEALYQLCTLSDGLVLVAGPTGAGKSTTLATLLDRINQTRPCHIVTIEDPIEYLHTPALGLINQRQVGSDTSSFHDALVAALRQDPDVILVGEIRDLGTIRTAITAAETGHLVFTTVHAGDCVGAIERLVAVFPADEQDGIRRQLAMVLRAVMAQHLLLADGLVSQGGPPPLPGRRGRVVCSEILMVTPAVANLVATGKSAQIYSVMESGSSQGMQTLEHDLARLWFNRQISETTAIAAARNPALVRDRLALLRQRGPGLIATPGGRR